ncbi:hypothetical protein BVX98_05000 [bacterium F11]|nr:hypothetical protein BVX98_05000 [bacterium F11]
MVIQKGSAVKIHYALKVDGQVVDSSSGMSPFAYTHGLGEIIPGLEKNLEGLKQGEKKAFSILPNEGYGDHNPTAIQKVSKDAFRQSEKIEIGNRVQGQKGNTPIQATVVEIGDKDVTLDFNHPLAGKTLNFDVEVVEVNQPNN